MHLIIELPSQLLWSTDKSFPERNPWHPAGLEVWSAADQVVSTGWVLFSVLSYFLYYFSFWECTYLLFIKVCLYSRGPHCLIEHTRMTGCCKFLFQKTAWIHLHISLGPMFKWSPLNIVWTFFDQECFSTYFFLTSFMVFFSNIIMTFDIYLAVYLSHLLHLKYEFMIGTLFC